MLRTYQVTQEDIDGANQSGLSINCPIARCLTRSGHTDVAVGFASSYVAKCDGGEYRALPEIAQYFAQAFDDGEDVEPITFEFDCAS